MCYSPRILSVEDNPETYFLLKHLLRESCKIAFANDADEALDLLDTEAFDLLLLDINLGDGKNGTELLHEVRQQEDLANVPAIALTAYAMPGDREDLPRKGFNVYVAKPFTKAELLEAIDRVHALT